MELDPTTVAAVSAALTRICQRNSFFGALALHARVEASGALPTAATDGRDIFLNPAFFGGLDAAEQEALLLHEVLHAALSHVPRRGGRDAKRWNIAADIVVNGMLASEGYRLPAGGVRDSGLEHLSVEEVYDLLARRSRRAPEQQAGDLLEERPGDAGPPRDQGELGEREARASGADGGEEQWEQARRQARMVAEGSVYGKLPAGMERELGQVGAGRLDWRSRLWRYIVRTPTDFQGFDRRFVGDELYLDGLDGETLHVAVAVDTSGSIDRGLLADFIGEVQAILRAYPHLRCELFYADAALHGPYRIGPRAAIPAPVGGGGTDFRPFFQRLEGERRRGRRPVAIYLTDGYGRFPERPSRCPTLWVVTPGGIDLSRLPFGEGARLVLGERQAYQAPRAPVR